MRRRDFIQLTGAAAALAMAPRLALSQQQKLRRIAYVSVPQPEPTVQTFRDALAESGYVDGKNVEIDYFWVNTADITNDTPVQAARAVGSNPDVIYANGAANAGIALEALTKTIPIVVISSVNPVALGLAQSIPHPGGNLTGQTSFNPELAGKHIAMLRECVPGLQRVALVEYSADANTNKGLLADTLQAAETAKIDIVRVDAADFANVEDCFKQAVAAEAQGIYYLPTANLDNNSFPNNPATLAALIASHPDVVPSFDADYAASVRPIVPTGMILNFWALVYHLPAISGRANNALTGGLFGYGSDTNATQRRTAQYVAQVLNGTRPEDLPIEGPTTIDFWVNLKTAKALGITLPPSVTLLATRTIG